MGALASEKFIVFLSPQSIPMGAVAYSGVPGHPIRTNATGYSGVNATA